jgi:hypothetical protein
MPLLGHAGLPQKKQLSTRILKARNRAVVLEVAEERGVVCSDVQNLRLGLVLQASTCPPKKILTAFAERAEKRWGQGSAIAYRRPRDQVGQGVRVSRLERSLSSGWDPATAQRNPPTHIQNHDGLEFDGPNLGTRLVLFLGTAPEVGIVKRPVLPVLDLQKTPQC